MASTNGIYGYRSRGLQNYSAENAMSAMGQPCKRALTNPALRRYCRRARRLAGLVVLCMPVAAAELGPAELTARAVAEFTARLVTVSPARAWELAAVANHLGRAKGAYRASVGGIIVYVTFGKIRVSLADLYSPYGGVLGSKSQIYLHQRQKASQKQSSTHE